MPSYTHANFFRISWTLQKKFFLLILLHFGNFFSFVLLFFFFCIEGLIYLPAVTESSQAMSTDTETTPETAPLSDTEESIASLPPMADKDEAGKEEQEFAASPSPMPDEEAQDSIASPSPMSDAEKPAASPSPMPDEEDQESVVSPSPISDNEEQKSVTSLSPMPGAEELESMASPSPMLDNEEQKSVMSPSLMPDRENQEFAASGQIQRAPPTAILLDSCISNWSSFSAITWSAAMATARRIRYNIWNRRDKEWLPRLRALYESAVCITDNQRSPNAENRNIAASSPITEKTNPACIPRIIHQIWLGSPVPARYDAWRHSWTKYNPESGGWQYRLHGDEELRTSFPYTRGQPHESVCMYLAKRREEAWRDAILILWHACSRTCLSLSIHLSVCLSVCLSIYLSISVCACGRVRMLACLLVDWSFG